MSSSSWSLATMAVQPEGTSPPNAIGSFSASSKAMKKLASYVENERAFALAGTALASGRVKWSVRSLFVYSSH